MRKIFLLLITVATLISCSSDDSISDQITGEWKLMSATIIDFTINPPTIDYSNDNIIYNFRSNGTLTVSGEENVGYTEGDYEYFFGKDYLGGGQPNPGESKILVVDINSTKWTYDLTDGIMTLSITYIDGPLLRFERN